MLRFLTAGSVDDGKSTLIGRLLYDTKAILDDQLAAVERTSQQRGTALDLSLLTDGLVAEREQGITIDVAYRYFATALRKFIIADAPGHEQYTRNMVTAASTAELAILLVDARHGVVTQTRRHATLAHLLGIPHLVVAVNKMDLVDYQRRACSSASSPTSAHFAERTGIERRALRADVRAGGDMVVDRGDSLAWYEGPTLLQILETVDVATGARRCAVSLSGAVRGASDRRALARGYMGRVESGSIAVGDRGHRAAVGPSDAGCARSADTTARRSAPACTPRSRWCSMTKSTCRAATCWCRANAVARHAARRSTRRCAGSRSSPLDRRRSYLLRHTTREVRARIDQHRSPVERRDAGHGNAAPETLAHERHRPRRR